MARLPVPGSDQQQWGDILNEFLSVSHDSSGTLQTAAITPLIPAGPAGPTGPQGPTGPDGVIENGYQSYYVQDPYVIENFNPGTGAVSFSTENVNIGSSVTVANSTITFQSSGTYLLYCTAIVQEWTNETAPMMQTSDLTFSVGLESAPQGGSYSQVPPYPLMKYSDTTSEYGGFMMSHTFQINHMITITSTPVNYRVILTDSTMLNGQASTLNVVNPTLNIAQLN